MSLLFRMLRRDWRGGELGVLFVALILAVTMVSGISGFASALKSALRQESHSFLAADVAVRDSRPLPSQWLDDALGEGLETAEVLTFRSMLYHGDDDMALASVKAVSDAYPLRGLLRLSDTAYGDWREHRGAPAPGEVWLEPRLFALMDLKVGDTVGIGEADFRIAAAIRSEPDRAGGFIGVGPRVMLNIADIPATRVVQPGSRVRYRQLFAGDGDAVSAFTAQLEERLAAGQRLQSVDSSQPAVGRALERAERFLLLAGSLAVILAGVAVALAARRYSERHQNYVALLKSLGAEAPRVRFLYAASLAIAWALALVLGWLLAWGLQAAALEAFAERLTAPPSLTEPRPYIIGAATALVCVVVFAWPPLARLTAVSPLRVLRSDVPLHDAREPRDYLIAVVAIALLMWAYSADLELTLIVLGGLSLVVLAGSAIAWSLLRGGRVMGMQAGSVWRLALASLQRHGLGNTLQLVVFAIAIMLLLLLTLLRTSLLNEWQSSVPEGAPNHFVLNIAPDELGAITTLLDDQDVARERLYPMLRGRVMAVAGDELPAEAPEGQPEQREANFTWSAEVPDGNELTAGRWWAPKELEAVSIEEGFAERLGIGVGDRIDLLIGSAPLSVEVTSLRTLDWESFKPNFFMVFPPGLLESYPVTYMTSFHLPPERKNFLNRLLKAHPTATVIEVDAIMMQLRQTLEQVSKAIELVLGLVLIAGGLVLVAGVQATSDLRLRESALLRALGASRGHILGGVTVEFIALGTMAGLMAVLAAEAAFWGLQTFVLELDYAPSPALWPVTVVVAALLIGALGIYNCRRVVRVAPATVLKEV
ncbi:MAG: FtsX-like permease family protein [Pseudomonadota bacterium]